MIHTLGHQPLFDCPGTDPLSHGHVQLRLGLYGIELHQHLALLNLIAFTYQNPVNDSAGARLYSLALARDDNGTAADYASIEWRQASPENKTSEADQQAPDTDTGNLAGLNIRPGQWSRKLI
ncbi:beta-ketoacyl synthase [Pseudomonas sp. StFLB209]|nr:beta-ketoacyl synthase [Pseudomonas sp. StFLB209]